MSHLVGNPEDQFSLVATQLNTNGVPISNMCTDTAKNLNKFSIPYIFFTLNVDV